MIFLFVTRYLYRYQFKNILMILEKNISASVVSAYYRIKYGTITYSKIFDKTI